MTVSVFVWTPSAGEPEQAVPVLDVPESLWSEGLRCETLLSCQFIFLSPMCNQTVLIYVPLKKTTPVYWQNEVPEGVRAAHYNKVSPSGAVYVRGTQPCNALGLLGFRV